MKISTQLFHLSFFLLFPILLFCQAQEEDGYPFPDYQSANIYKNIARFEKEDYAKTKRYTRELLEYGKRCEDDGLVLFSYYALVYFALDFEEREDFEKVIIENDQAIQSIINQQNISEYAEYYFEHLNNFSVHLFQKNKIKEADALLTNAIKTLKTNSFRSEIRNHYLLTFYQNLSSYKNLQWKFSEAISLLEKASRIPDLPYYALGDINRNLSFYYEKTENTSQALEHARLALENYKADEIDTTDDIEPYFYLVSLIRLANLHILRKETSKSLQYLNKLKSFSLDNYPLVQSRFFRISAQINQLKDQGILALKNYQKALNIQKAKLPNRISNQAKIYQAIAQIHKEQNQVDSTFHYIQEAIILLSNNSKLKGRENNPQQFTHVVYKQTLLDLLYNKSKIALEQYTKDQDICDLRLARQSIEAAQNLADKIRFELASKEDKEFFSERGHKIYEQAMQIAALSEKEKHSTTNLDLAYRAMESSRALLLAEAVYQSNSNEFAGIPNKLIKREKNLKEQIVECERQIFQLEQKDANAEKYKKKKQELQSNFEKFTDSLRLLHPDYYNLKFATDIPKIKTLQADLTTDNQTFIEYFVGQKYIHALIVAEDRYELKTWKKPKQLTEKIRTLRSAIYEESNYNEQANTFTEYAHRLYQELVEPLGDLPERLVIIPDGVLNYLPFDVLLTKKPEYTGTYQSHNYLLYDKQIAYDYSATLRMQERKEVSGKHTFTGFAPYYGEEESEANRGVGNLKYNIAEVDTIKKLIGGLTFTGRLAGKKKFKSQSSNTAILHFAGHAVQEEINPDFSHLLFSGNTEINRKNQMPVREIYAQFIPTKMVVLSACNTGMGAVREGEGMYSLGRAFSYAGAHSLISTLWSVNDESTKEIMTQFYINLKAGKTKDEALREAKKHYITELSGTNKRARPLFWAGFVAFGDMDDLEFNSGWFDWFND